MIVGIYGGSFNPIHTGHAMLANYIAQSGVVDEVWLMVSPLNPLKAGTDSGDALAGNRERLEMAEIVATDCRGVRASGFEFTLPIPSYTYNTLCKLREAYADIDFRLIIGSDNWQEFSRWRNPDEIIGEFGVLVYPRPGYGIEGPLPEGVTLLDEVPTAYISSTLVRKMIAEGKDINFLVPPEVARYIGRHRLYK